VFSAIGPALFGDSVIGHIGLLALSATILTSASASTQTTILPTARTTLSMGVYKALPTSFAKIHRKYLTPTVSTIVMVPCRSSSMCCSPSSAAAFCWP